MGYGSPWVMSSPSPLPVDPQDLWIQGLGPGVYVAGPDPWEAAEQGGVSSPPCIGICPLLLLPSVLPGIRVFSNKWALHISPGALPESRHPGPPGPRPSGCSRAGDSPRGDGQALPPQLQGWGLGAGRLSPPPAPRGPAPHRWSLCVRGPPGPQTGRCRSRSSGCGHASRYPTPRRSPSLTCPRKRRSPGGSPGRTRSVWKVDGGRGRLVTVRPGTPASGHTPSTPTGAPLPAGRLTPFPVFFKASAMGT